MRASAALLLPPPPRAALTGVRVPLPTVAALRSAASARSCVLRSPAMSTAASHSASPSVSAGSPSRSGVGPSPDRIPSSSPIPISSPSASAGPSSSPPSLAAAAAPPSSPFLWSGYPLPCSSLAPSPVPEYGSLASWPSDPLRVFCWWYGDAERHYAAVPAGCQRSVSWPNNMQLATADRDGQPHVRNVLLKGVDGAGLIFFTNRSGNKGRQLAANGRAAVVFYWKGLERQVRVEGDMWPVSDAESDGYFHSRPVGSQVSAAVSPQSRPISSRAALEEHYVQQINALTSAALSNRSGAAMPPSSLRIAQLPPLPAPAAGSSSASSSSPPPPLSSSAAHSHHQQALQSLASAEQQQPSGGLQRCIERPADWGGYRLIPRLFEFWEDGQYRLHSRVEYSRQQASKQQQSGSESLHLTTAQSEWGKRFLAP